MCVWLIQVGSKIFAAAKVFQDDLANAHYVNHRVTNSNGNDLPLKDAASYALVSVMDGFARRCVEVRHPVVQ